MMFKKKSVLVSIALISLCLSSSALENENLRLGLITMVYSVTAFEDLPEVNFLFYAPIITENSLPVWVRLSAEPQFNSHAAGFQYIPVKGDNRLLRFTLKDCVKNVKNYIAVEFFTLKRVSRYEDMPETVLLSDYSYLSGDSKYYIGPSLSIQSDAPILIEKAYEFLYGSWTSGNVIDVLKKIMNFTGNEIVPETRPGGQTALATLNNKSGVCTGKANLAAGLCRALGIPARVLHVLASHFIIEAWIPNYGWVSGKPTFGVFPGTRHTWTPAWIVDIEDENFAGEHTDGVVTYIGLEENVNAKWDVEYEEILNEERWNEMFATIESTGGSNDILFEKGAELWRLFCRLTCSGLSDQKLSLFSDYQKLYFESLVAGDMQNALSWADLAISEGKNVLAESVNQEYVQGLSGREQPNRSRKMKK
jgi:hypothetical protein